MVKAGIPVADWITENIDWSTQFNDLRVVDGAKVPTYLLELKKQALLARRTVIRDADLVNSVELLWMINTNEDLRFAFRRGMFVLARRESSPTFSDVNAKAEKTRADASRFEAVKSQLTKFDNFADQLPIMQVPHRPESDIFSIHLDKIEASGLLSEYQHTEFLKARTFAREQAGAGLVRFGHIYGELAPRESNIAEQELELKILRQLCRAAHVLTVPAVNGITPVTSDKDLDSTHVSAILGHTTHGPSVEESHQSSSEWFELWPTFSLPDTWLIRQSFKDIDAYRSSREATAYFEAVRVVREHYQTPDFEVTYVRYLVALDRYLKHIKVAAKVEVLDWRKTLRDNALAGYKADRRWPGYIAKGSIPLIFSLSAPKVYEFSTHTALALPATAGLMAVGTMATFLAVESVNHILERHQRKHPVPLSSLEGTTATPPNGDRKAQKKRDRRKQDDQDLFES